MLEKFRGTNEAEPRKQCESLARVRVAFSMFLATLVPMSFEIEVHTVPHFKAPVNAKVGPRGLKSFGTFR